MRSLKKDKIILKVFSANLIIFSDSNNHVSYRNFGDSININKSCIVVKRIYIISCISSDKYIFIHFYSDIKLIKSCF
jgi:hypothetical protein